MKQRLTFVFYGKNCHLFKVAVSQLSEILVVIQDGVDVLFVDRALDELKLRIDDEYVEKRKESYENRCCIR